MPNPTRLFQDITHRFADPAPPTPITRPKRKPKTPGGALGEKLRLRVIDSTKSTANAFPSSLPPSSPPLYSSSSRGLSRSEDEVAQEIQDRGEVEEEEEPYRYANPDFGTMQPLDDEDADAENRAPTPATNSDPFGFFAVERKLKAKRALASPPPLPQAAVLRASRRTDDKGRDDGRVMPATPHKPKLGKRRLSPDADVFSPAATSLASSPSPVKAGTSFAVVEKDGGDDEGAPPRSKRPRQSSEASVPPRRSTRGGSKTAAPKAKGVTKPKTRARKAPTKTKARGKKKVEDNEPEDDQQEKFEAERRARLEYFRKLDDYSFEKEDVYVV
ncbi:hypothetical protein DFH07DRAFT_212870 [Mycena maculata]|uniref:Uncharacterized protein n=1 Tax=Mycena maculata TaxID=230809 RepID=A0AAD7NRR5_9AGAR|nr:hypothetical protein DFH07DRAFT_212870 [Mycena maculata]